MKQAVDNFLRYLVVEKGSARNTTDAYENDLNGLTRFAQDDLNKRGTMPSWESFGRQGMLSYLLFLKGRGYASSTQARKVAAARSFFEFLSNEGGIKENPTENLDSPKVGKSLPQPISLSEVHRLLEQPARLNTPEGKRDTAMLQLLYASGMRVSELMSMNCDDIDVKGGFVRCCGKGNKERVVPVHAQAIAAVNSYTKEVRPQLIRNSSDPALFLNLRGERLTRQGFWQILRGYARAAKLNCKVTPHTLRHSFATHMLNGGADLKSLQELLGHANISTTQVYTHLTSEHVRRTYEKTHPRAE